jgi:Ca2+-transporting ATPase
LIAFGMGSMEGGFAVGRTMAFSVLAISQLVHAVNMRSRRSVLGISPFSNPYLTGSILLVTGVQVALVQLPALGVLFGTVPLSMHHWIWVAGLSLVPLVFCECYKWLKKRFR